jgi:hypothetical protein
MCPGCVGSALLLMSGASSAGGLAALTLRPIARLRACSFKPWGGKLRDGAADTARPGVAQSRVAK